MRAPLLVRDSSALADGRRPPRTRPCPRRPRPRARQLDGHVGHDPAGPRRHHQHAVGEEDRLRDAVRHQHDRRAGRFPETQQLHVEPVARQRVERAEGLVEQQDGRIQRERPCDSRRAGASRRTAGAGGRARTRSSRRDLESSSRPRSRDGRAPSRPAPAETQTLSSSVRHGSRRGSWKTRPTRGSGPATGVPWMSTLPSSGLRRPEIRRSSVLLPDPFGPTTATTGPAGTPKDTPSRTTSRCPPTVKLRLTSLSSIAFSVRASCRPRRGDRQADGMHRGGRENADGRGIAGANARQPSIERIARACLLPSGL